jgi:hypothetical protein
VWVKEMLGAVATPGIVNAQDSAMIVAKPVAVVVQTQVFNNPMYQEWKQQVDPKPKPLAPGMAAKNGRLVIFIRSMISGTVMPPIIWTIL